MMNVLNIRRDDLAAVMRGTESILTEDSQILKPTLQSLPNVYFVPLLSSFELDLFPFLLFILVLVERGLGFICVNLYCLLSIFLIYLFFSWTSNRRLIIPLAIYL